MIDVEAILTKIENSGVRVIRNSNVICHIPGTNSGDLATLIRYKLNGKSGQFETVQAINVFGATELAGISSEGIDFADCDEATYEEYKKAAALAGINGEDIDPDALGDAIMGKYPNLLFVPPAGTKGAEPWLVFTFN